MSIDRKIENSALELFTNVPRFRVGPMLSLLDQRGFSRNDNSLSTPSSAHAVRVDADVD